MRLGIYSSSMELATLRDEMMNFMFSFSGFWRGLLSLIKGALRTDSIGLIKYSECRKAIQDKSLQRKNYYRFSRNSCDI